MNESVLTDIATSNVIMMETLIYALGSIVFLVILDFYAAKAIGDRRRPAYKALFVHRQISFFVVAAVTAVLAILCFAIDLSMPRGMLTFLGIPYFLAVLYYMIKVFRRVRSEDRRRR